MGNRELHSTSQWAAPEERQLLEREQTLQTEKKLQMERDAGRADAATMSTLSVETLLSCLVGLVGT